MSDRKYRQHGYQDDDRRDRGRSDGPPRRPAEPRDPRLPRDPRAPNVPGYRERFRCGRCGHVESAEVGRASRCGHCGVELHACVHCDSFDPGARFECRQPVTQRVSPKDAANDCEAFAPRVQVERDTGSSPATPGGASSAKKALDDLFKF